jgi:hypothetical protein
MYRMGACVQWRASCGHSGGDMKGSGKGEREGKEGSSSRIVPSESAGGVREGLYIRDPVTGAFMPGTKGPGRKPKQTEKAYLEAVKDAVPPERISQLIADALDIAQRQNSWRGIVEVLQVALQYGAGKPTQRVVQTDGNLEQLLAALAEPDKLTDGQGPSEEAK